VSPLFRRLPAVLWIAAATVLVAAGLRAAARAITHDEALTYAVFITKPWRRATGYSPVQLNHALLVALSKLSVTLFPVSAFTLRLPSVVAAAAFSLSVGALIYRLTARARAGSSIYKMSTESSDTVVAIRANR